MKHAALRVRSVKTGGRFPLPHFPWLESEDKDISHMEEAHERKELRCSAVGRRNELVFSLMNLTCKYWQLVAILS